MSSPPREPGPAEVARRYENMRAAMAEHGVDALLVSGSEYSGFEGAVRYMSGFRIVHRYAYVLLRASGDPLTIFPTEARYVGEHAEGWVRDPVFAEHPGAWLAAHLAEQGVKRLGVYGLDYIVPVRDYRALAAAPFELVDFDVAFDLARAVKSAEELALVRESMAINEAGFWAVHEAYAPGRTQAELMAAAEELFARRGTGRQTMDMVVWGHDGAATPEFRIPDPLAPIAPTDLLLYSLEVAGPGGHWVEFSRPLTRGPISADTQLMLDAYDEYHAAARASMRAGASAHDVHRAVSAPFHERGYPLGHVTGHSIGMTMIEHPRIGEGIDVELREGMVFSMHPHAIAGGGSACLYMQDTWCVGAAAGEPLSSVPLRIFDGTEPRPTPYHAGGS
ncbi:MAG TPA: M24 family metallopeptidase [Solirubrobacteraceae bacterium]|nr:M24 family metallopeptidase [Solirubrobacteraceae bacterium]